MEFRKTTVLPLGAPAEARREFRALVDKPLVLFVVVGQGTDKEDLVSRAGQLAGLEGEPRWVVWARALEDLKPEIAKLSESKPGFLDSIVGGAAQAFVTSVDDQVRDVIPTGEQVSNARIFWAYSAAEES
jgi:hypothetical protein